MADDLYYGDAAYNKRLFAATAIVTAPVIFSTAAGTGGPLLWNNSTDVLGRIVSVNWAITTASGVAGALGWTSGTGQASAPSATTAIDSVANQYIGGPTPKITPYRVGTVTAHGVNFATLGQISTGAVSVPQSPAYVELKRSIIIPPNGGWWSIAASATLTSAVLQVTVVWEEINASSAF